MGRAGLEEGSKRHNSIGSIGGYLYWVLYNDNIVFIPSTDIMTSIVFNYLIPIFLAHFIGMGLLPLLFKAMKLVNTSYKLEDLIPQDDRSSHNEEMKEA